MALKLQSKDLYSIIEKEHPDWPEGLNPNTQHWAYNGLDSAVTLTCLNSLKSVLRRQNSPHAATSYHFVRAMQAPAMDMMLRGVMIQQRVRQDETQRLQTKRTRAQQMLDQIADAIWGPEKYIEIVKSKEMFTPIGKKGQPLTPRERTVKTPIHRTRPRGLNPNSDRQVLLFFNEALGFPTEYEIRKTADGNIRTPTANDRTLRKWAKRKYKGPGINVRDRTVDYVLFAQPFVSLILTIREIDKQLQVLRTPLEPDGRMRCSYNVVGTETGRWSSSKNQYGRGCVLAGTQVLTPDGWRNIELIEPFDTVMQWSDGLLEWAPAQPFKTQYDGLLYKVEGEQIHQEVTEEHRVISRGWKSGHETLPARQVAELSQRYIPIAGMFQNDDIGTQIPPWWPMIMADFSKQREDGWRGEFKKQRKIERFLEIVKLYALEYTEQKGKLDYRRFYVKGYAELPKRWGPWVLSLSSENLSELVEESRYWDSHDRGAGFIFFTADEEQAKWFSIACHLCGRGVTVHQKISPERSYQPGGVMWWVNVKSRDFAQVGKKHWSTRPFKGEVFCLTVPSSLFLIRSNGKISVTGNTNLQNISDTQRRMFCADDGMILISPDLEQAESRVTGLLIWLATGDRTYLNACESADLHTTVARMSWPELRWSADDAENRELAERPCKDHPSYSYRDAAKRFGHGSNYQGSSFGIAQAVGVPIWLVDNFQKRYFAAFPAHLDWFKSVRNDLQSFQYLDTPLFRRRIFFGRPDDDQTLREAIAFGPQSTVAELLNLILYRCWERSILPHSHLKHLPIQLLLQGHDSFVCQTPDLPLSLPRVVSEINVEFQNAAIPLERGNQRIELVIPGDFMTGWNWAKADERLEHFSDGNPDGLRKWRGRETRTRVQGASVAPSEWLSGPLPRVF